ncbi:MAG TPA: glycosyltransferase family 2 protein [Candidatus Methanoperedens sp.]|nr:glycosyltransferase family 2 protein [Candidatus Methanoperedens sp.]
MPAGLRDEANRALGAVTPATAPAGAGAAPAGRVSVAIPVYNGARFLADTLESVLRQTRPADEIVLVDDASTDGSPEEIRRAARRDARVRAVRNDRTLGMVANWNRCLELCTGEWVKVLGQDDRLAPECLEVLLAATAEGNDLVLSLREFSFEPGVPRARALAYRFSLPTLRSLGVAAGTVTPAALARLVTRVAPCANFLGEPLVGLVRRERLAAAGGFSPALSQLADYELWLRLGLTRPFTFVDRPLGTFRVHAASATQAHLADRLRGVHLENALVLAELLAGAVFAPARALHPPLAVFARRALLAEIENALRLARRSERQALALRRALAEQPLLAAWCRREPTLADRLGALAGRVGRARRILAATLRRHG